MRRGDREPLTIKEVADEFRRIKGVSLDDYNTIGDDELIFDFIIAYGDDAENHTLSPQEVSEHCFWLKELRDIFAEM